MLTPLLLLVIAAVLALAFWAFASAPERASNRSFAAFVWLGAAWVTNDLFFWSLGTISGLTWARAAFSLGFALQVAFLRFAWAFFYPARRARGAAWALALASAGAVACVWWTPPLARVERLPEGGLALEFNAWTYLLGAAVAGLWLLGQAVVASGHRAQAPEAQPEGRALVITPRITGLLATIAIVVLPLCGVTALLPFTGLAILVGALLYARDMLRLRLLRPPSGLEELRLFPVWAKLGLLIALWSLAGAGLVLATARAFVGPSAGWPGALVVASLGLVLVAMGLVASTRTLFAEPLERLTRVAVSVSEGRLDARVGLPLGPLPDELGHLGAAIDHMIERLAGELESGREASERLQRTERLAVAGTLAAGVAHEVNNPLAAVSSLVQLARDKSGRGEEHDPEVRELLGDALTQMERVAKALQDLLAFARPLTRAPRDTSWREVVEDTLRLLRHDKRFRRLEITSALEEAGPLYLEVERLQQVLVNLLLNARDAVAERCAREPGRVGRIQVRAYSAAEGEVLEVRDEGVGLGGLSDELRGRLFQPFVTTKVEAGGTGLGLAVIRDLVRDLGGQVTLEDNEEPEGGALARVVLPPTPPARPPCKA